MSYTIFDTPVLKSLLRGISLLLCKILGWKTSGELPREAKYVIVVAPHTSNWDVFYGMIIAFAMKLNARFIAKKELFRGPFSPLMTWLGAIAIDRASSHNIVEQMTSKFKESEKFVLAIAPEGSRHRMDCWKSGFYHIALNAHVPIMLTFIDYESKTGGTGPLIYPTGDLEKDMSIIRNFYRTVKGKYPENTSPVVIHSKS
jgi:1-acyl-sn-glycerol-3-phosphate acyltransferase